MSAGVIEGRVSEMNVRSDSEMGMDMTGWLKGIAMQFGIAFCVQAFHVTCDTMSRWTAYLIHVTSCDEHDVMSVCICGKNAQPPRHVPKRDVTFKWATFVTNVIVSRDDVAVQMSPT